MVKRRIGVRAAHASPVEMQRGEGGGRDCDKQASGQEKLHVIIFPLLADGLLQVQSVQCVCSINDL